MVGEFDRLKARLTGGEFAEAAGHNIDEINAEGPAPAAIDVLTNLFGLSRFERDVLLLCAGVEMNSELAHVCGEAPASGHRPSVTFGLALAALEAPHWSALTPVGPLRRWRLVVPLSEWKLTIGVFVTNPVTWSWEDFLARPQFKDRSDFHCVTSWSRYDNDWEGVSFKHIMSVVKPLSLAKFVLFKSYNDYTTNLPLDACDDDDVLLTYTWNGKPLTKEHGGPVRVIVPKRYAWKGAKWVKEITFSDKDEKGFWEVRGYSNTALPWKNDRYG